MICIDMRIGKLTYVYIIYNITSLYLIILVVLLQKSLTFLSSSLLHWRMD